MFTKKEKPRCATFKDILIFDGEVFPIKKALSIVGSNWVDVRTEFDSIPIPVSLKNKKGEEIKCALIYLHPEFLPVELGKEMPFTPYALLLKRGTEEKFAVEIPLKKSKKGKTI